MSFALSVRLCSQMYNSIDFSLFGGPLHAAKEKVSKMYVFLMFQTVHHILTTLLDVEVNQPCVSL